MVSAQGVDGFTRALHALIDNQLPSKKDKTRAGGIRSSLRVGNKDGGVLFLFWTRDMESSSGLEILDSSPDQFAGLLDSLHKAVGESAAIPESQQDQFRVLCLSGNSARVVVRDYLETPLPKVQTNLLKWFDDLRIADPSKEFQGRPNNRFSLLTLAATTVPKKTGNKADWGKLHPDLLRSLMHAAITGSPIPETALVACLDRIRAERGLGFRPPRLALIKLYLNRSLHPRGGGMQDTLSADEKHHAYLYGRLLRLMEEIQRAALGKVNATVVDKFYGTFAAAPALIFSRLHDNAQHHLSKLKKDKPNAAFRLDQQFAAVMKLLPPAAPAEVLSLADQGRFALGYYHQKAKTFEAIAAAKAAKLKKQKPTSESDPTHPQGA